MTHISAVIRNMNSIADEVGDIEFQLRELTNDVKRLMDTHIPHFKRTEDTYELIDNGEQTTLGDFE